MAEMTACSRDWNVAGGTPLNWSLDPRPMMTAAGAKAAMPPAGPDAAPPFSAETQLDDCHP